MTHVLEVSDLSIAFEGVRVIDRLSFRIEAGSTLAIVGRNGSGKTVLFKALIGAIPAQGTIRWAPGTNIGYVPQKLDIARDLPLTGRDFLHAKADVTHTRYSDVQRVMALVELPLEIADQRIGTLSGGQLQRLLLAFALMGHPTVLLFDEPTAGVDEPGERNIYGLIHRLQQRERLTVLLISHDLSLVHHEADHILFLSHHGSYFGPTAEVLTPERVQELQGNAVPSNRP